MRLLPAIAALAAFAGVFAGLAAAHPMGNLSVNHYARLEPGAKGISVTYVLDLAEIPTFELTQTWGVAKDAPRGVLNAKAAEQARQWIAALTFIESGTNLKARVENTELSIIEGAGNLPVFRITTKLFVPATGGRLVYEDGNYPTRAGWREIVIRTTPGADLVKASKGDTDLSQALTAYPQDPTKAPPQDANAWFEWKPLSSPLAPSVTEVRKPVIEAAPTSVAVQPAPVAAPTPPSAQAQDIARDVRPPEAPSGGTIKRGDEISRILRLKEISWPLMLTLLGLAFVGGALHALEPGHGKTMVAAYLVGERGTAKHALILGSMVTFTHTISVFALGLATMFLSRYIMPDRISKVLGVISGLTIVWIGGAMLFRRLNPQPAPDHDHDLDHEDHDQTHSHGGLSHTHNGQTHSHVPAGDISIGSLIALGASGGLVPCPSALILLLSAISIGRVALGMVLLLSFSLGLALVLMATGLAVLYAKNLFPEGSAQSSRFFRYMPIVSAAFIFLIGVAMTGVSLGWIPAVRLIG
jgi:nickel/cobalt exporter